MNDKWVTGKTYWEIFNDALTRGVMILEKEQKIFLDFCTGNLGSHDLSKLFYECHGEKDIQKFISKIQNKQFTNRELNDILHIKSREIRIIYLAVLTYNGYEKISEELHPYLPGMINISDEGNALQSYDFLLKLIDPMIYVLQFSSFSQDKLYKSGYQNF